MADLVRDDVGLREVAWRLEPPPQLLVEREVDVDAAVERTVERAHRRRAGAACRIDGAREEHEPRLGVAAAGGLEHLAPDVLRVGEDAPHEPLHLVLAGFGALGLAARQTGNFAW